MPSSTASTSVAGSFESAPVAGTGGTATDARLGTASNASAPPTTTTTPATMPSSAVRMPAVSNRISGGNKRANGICAILLHPERHATGAVLVSTI